MKKDAARKRIMIDMDDVMVIKGFENLVEKFLGHKIDIKGTNFFAQDLLGDRKDEFFEEFKTVNMYDYVEIIDGAYEVIKELNEKHDVYIVTAYIWRDVPEFSGSILKFKFDYLMREFPFLDPYKYIFAYNKTIIDFDVRIDDRLKNLEGSSGQKLLYSAFHNGSISDNELKEKDVTRVSSWEEIKEILL